MTNQQASISHYDSSRKMAIAGARNIRDYLFKMRDNYAADCLIGPEKAALWCDAALLHLHENGVLVVPEVPPEVAATKMQGDSWRAFHVFEVWLLATRGVCSFDQAFKVAVKQAPTPLDVFLMIAIANAFGKSEQWLNATEDMLSRSRKAAKFPRPNRRDPLRKKIISLITNERSDDRSMKQILDSWKGNVINGLRLNYDSGADKWIVSDEDSTEDTQNRYSQRGMEKMFTESK